MSLEGVCQAIAEVAGRAESGIALSLNAPPEQLTRYPTSWVNPLEGTVTPGSEDAMWIHTVELIVYVTPRVGNLPVEFANVAPLVNSVEATFRRAMFAHEMAAGVTDCFVRGYRVGLRDFAGSPQHSITFSLFVKEHTR